MVRRSFFDTQDLDTSKWSGHSRARMDIYPETELSLKSLGSVLSAFYLQRHIEHGPWGLLEYCIFQENDN